MRPNDVTDSTLLELLSHPNPQVRKLAQQIIELLKEYEQDEREEVYSRAQNTQ